ncbi:MAG: phenylalanine--tRNA ligase subunit alpha [Rickettsiales bacterium]
MTLENIFTNDLNLVTDSKSLEELRLKYVGKKGLISLELAKIGKLSPTERKIKGQEINKIKSNVLSAIQQKKTELHNLEINNLMQAEHLDITLPERKIDHGSIHPISYVIAEVTEIFAKLGFTAVAGPEIEDDYHNFTALNIAEQHPARQMHDTFYFSDLETLLRTHTSSVQIRTMRNGKPPFAIIAPGKTYRSDSDATHTPMFHQIEALYIAEKASMGQLKFVIQEFLDQFFGTNLELRFRNSFFPFTEPSAEVDIGCKILSDRIDLNSQGDYLEIMGCGLVHPKVLTAANIDSSKYQGFALGMGVERIAMLKYGMRDLRHFFSAHKNWINSYNFKPWQ